MQAAVVLLEIVLFVALICGLHAARARVGLAPLYAIVGLLEAWLFFGSKFATPVRAPMFFEQPVSLAYMLVLPGMLAIIFVIYVLEGTQEARRMVWAVLVAYLLHAGIDLAHHWHVTHPPGGGSWDPGHLALKYSMRERIASLLAVAADFVILLVVYQFVRNKAPKLPYVVAVFAAFVLALTADSLVFSLVFIGPTAIADMNFRMIQKFQAGLAVGLPTSLYVWWQLRRHRELLTNDIVERGAFDILKMHREIEEANERLASLKDSFGRYVPPDIVEQIARDPASMALGGEQRAVSVLFCDMRGYSTLVEGMPAREVIGLLNRYLERLTEPILAERGMINEIEGDGVLAVFGAPLALPDHAARAVAAAVAMQRAVEAFNAECEADGTAEAWRALGIDRIRVRIGVHSGPAVVGNIGSEHRIKYAVVGDTVNTAARVEGLCKSLGVHVLVSEQTFEALPDDVRDALRWVDHGEHAVKGRRSAVRAWELDVGLGGIPARTDAAAHA